MPKKATDEEVLKEGEIMDLITGKPVKDTPKERIRQEVVHQLIFEYQIAPESMATDFRMKVEGKSRKVDVAIFEAGKDHVEANLIRVIVCRPSPNVGRKGVVKIRDFKQAETDLAELKLLMEAADSC